MMLRSAAKVVEDAVTLAPVSGGQFPANSEICSDISILRSAERFGSKFIHLHITANDDLRAIRYRDSEQDGSLFEIADRHPAEAKIDELRGLASVVLHNNGSVAELETNLLNHAKALSQAQDRECLSRLL